MTVFYLIAIFLIFQLHDLRQEANTIVQDNENLLDKLDKFSAVSKVDPDRYIFLAENAQIVVNENELLKVGYVFPDWQLNKMNLV